MMEESYLTRKATDISGITGVEPIKTRTDTCDIPKFDKTVWLSSPTMHGDELKYMTEAYEQNWMSTIGHNIDEVERLASEFIGCKYAVALSCGTSALHLAVKLAGVKLSDKVFCSDMTFDATVNPVVYEGGVPVFIDTEYDTWNMNPVALEKAFELYPDVRVVVVANLYGTPAKLDEIVAVCKAHGAILIEDAAESLGATYKGRQTGTFGTYNAISFNGNKIITGSAGGMLLTDDLHAANKVRKWSTQSREDAPWYQHEELGYNYRMSNVIAGVVRGQWPYLTEHIEQKKKIYERYKDGLSDLPVSMNPYDRANSVPNFWLSCLLVDADAMCEQVRSDNKAIYYKKPGQVEGHSCPTEIFSHLMSHNAQCRPIWKPMHLQPIYRMNGFVTSAGYGRGVTNAYINEGGARDVGAEIFDRGLCLPSDNKMTEQEQDRIIEIIHRCFE
jgi:dTDP-4-amino-4,6-dideoxygalactose transaminase